VLSWPPFVGARTWPPRGAPRNVRTREPIIDPAHALTRVEVDVDALTANFRLFGRLVGGIERAVPVVKSNAYGHGLALVADVLRKEGARWYGVNALDEGLALRGHVGDDPRIIVLGYVAPERFGEALGQDLDLVLTNVREIEALDDAAKQIGRRARVHVKVETGTHRRGMTADDLDALVPLATRLQATDLEGIATHFANIEDTLEHDYAEEQLDRFQAAVDRLAADGVRFARRHVACTAASLLFPQTSFELSRMGIGLYGLWPSRETWVSYRNAGRDPVELRPCLRWVTRVTQVKEVPRGAFVGYGKTYRMTADGALAVLPVGYNEGYDRHLSNVAHVLVRGQRAPVRGRVCMNMILVDVSHIPDARVGDEAVLLGSQGTETITEFPRSPLPTCRTGSAGAITSKLVIAESGPSRTVTLWVPSVPTTGRSKPTCTGFNQPKDSAGSGTPSTSTVVFSVKPDPFTTTSKRVPGETISTPPAGLVDIADSGWSTWSFGSYPSICIAPLPSGSRYIATPSQRASMRV